jgi:hypothetical protein
LCEIVFVATGPIALSCRDCRLAVFSIAEREPHRLTSSAGKISLGSKHGGAL